MSEGVAEKIRAGVCGSPETLALSAIGRYLDDPAEIAHADSLLAAARILP